MFHAKIIKQKKRCIPYSSTLSVIILKVRHAALVLKSHVNKRTIEFEIFLFLNSFLAQTAFIGTIGVQGENVDNLLKHIEGNLIQT